MGIWHPRDDIHDRLPLAREIVDVFVGPRISAGVSRWVFECRQDKTCVVKMELGDDAQRFQNRIEWVVWQQVKNNDELSQWFAPCVDISESGVVLIQKRVETPVPKNKYPRRMPNFFNDMKLVNYGLFEGRLVACDYGILLSDALLRSQKRLAPSRWYDESTS